MDKLDKLSRKFSLELLKEIGIDNLREVIKLNSEETDKNICYTHNFCDANQVMLDVMGYKDSEVEDVDWDDFMIEMTKVWDEAKKNNFYINPLTNGVNHAKLDKKERG